jgi:hypothetical protein
MVQCIVIPHVNPQRAAELFLGSANVKPIPPIAEFTTAIKAGRELEIALKDILTRAGYRVSYARGPGVITCIAALKRVYKMQGDKVLYQALITCKYLWGLDPHGVASPIVRGMGLFHNEFGQIDRDHLKKAVQKQFDSPTNLAEAARIDSQGSTRPLDFELKEMLYRMYNKGLTANKKLKRKES